MLDLAAIALFVGYCTNAAQGSLAVSPVVLGFHRV